MTATRTSRRQSAATHRRAIDAAAMSRDAWASIRRSLEAQLSGATAIAGSILREEIDRAGRQEDEFDAEVDARIEAAHLDGWTFEEIEAAS